MPIYIGNEEIPFSEGIEVGTGNVRQMFLGNTLIYGVAVPPDLRLRDHTGDLITDTSGEQITVV